MIAFSSQDESESQVAQLLVRDLEQDIADNLRKLAVIHKRSTEEEHREALRSYVRDNLAPVKRTFADTLAAMPFFADDPIDLFEI